MAAHNLPGYATPFVGRLTEIAEITNRLIDADCRLLTLVGPGGIGKTRLAIQAAAQYAAQFVDGIFFVPLQPLNSPDFMVSTIADVIGFQFKPGNDLMQQLLGYFREQKLLLVMDNLEHLTDGIPLCSQILNAAPNVRLLITSRERLNLQEEWVLDLGGLAFPTSEELIDIERYSAVQLFLLHARRVRAEFSLNEARKQDVIRVCRLVGGMPLAIEIAAAWMRVLPCDAIAAEIERSLDILESPTRNVEPRHQSLRAALEPTWNRLPIVEQEVYKRLSVFRGGFTREAAEWVAGSTIRTLSALVDRSLLRMDAKGRYDIHELLRQYTEERLAQNPEEAQQARDTHASYFMRFLERCGPKLHNRQQRAMIQDMESDLDNIRAAWHWAVHEVNFTAIQKGAHVYYDLNDIRGRYQEMIDATSLAIQRLERIDVSDERDFTLAILYNISGLVLIRLGRFDEARVAFDHSVRCFQTLDQRPLPGLGTEPLIGLGLLASTVGNYAEAVAHGEAALKRIDVKVDKLNFIFNLYVLANATYSLGQFETAFGYALKAHQVSAELGDQWFGSYILVTLGSIARALEDYDQAREYYQVGYQINEAFDDLGGMAFALNGMARIAWLRGDFQDAARLFQQGHDLYDKIHDPGGLATSIFGLGDAAQAAGDYPTGSLYFQQALKMAIDLHWPPLILLILTGIGDFLLQMGASEQAVELLALSVHHPANEPPTRRRAEQLLVRAKALLPANVYDAARARGEEVGMDDMAQSILEQLRLMKDYPKPHLQYSANQFLVDPLTPRELEILYHMGAGLTNREIADQLIIGVSTVKKHITHIYNKLGASDRIKAINHARALELLPTSTP